MEQKLNLGMALNKIETGQYKRETKELKVNGQVFTYEYDKVFKPSEIKKAVAKAVDYNVFIQENSLNVSLVDVMYALIIDHFTDLNINKENVESATIEERLKNHLNLLETLCNIQVKKDINLFGFVMSVFQEKELEKINMELELRTNFIKEQTENFKKEIDTILEQKE